MYLFIIFSYKFNGDKVNFKDIYLSNVEIFFYKGNIKIN